MVAGKKRTKKSAGPSRPRKPRAGDPPPLERLDEDWFDSGASEAELRAGRELVDLWPSVWGPEVDLIAAR